MDERSHEEVHAHEGSDVHARPLVTFFIAFLVVGAFAFWVVDWSYHALVKYTNAHQGDAITRVASPKAEIPKSLELRNGGPQVTTIPSSGLLLQPDPVKDMNEMRSAQLGKLNSFGWVDREKGLVHVPIEKAMAMTLERSMVKAQAAEPTAVAATAPAAAPAAPAASAAPVSH